MREQKIVWKKRAPKKEGFYLCKMKNLNLYQYLEWCEGGWNVCRHLDGTVYRDCEIPKSRIAEWADMGRE